MESRIPVVEIDLAKVTCAEELHAALAQALAFPSFYGRNWDAFWDAITGLVDMPEILRLRGWSVFSDRLPDEARHLSKCLDDLAEQHPSWSSKVERA
jgi:RNAse (barnase) inhibitor barstar